MGACVGSRSRASVVGEGSGAPALFPLPALTTLPAPCLAEALLAARPLPDLPDVVSGGGTGLEPMGGPGPPELPQHATFTTLQPATATAPAAATANAAAAPTQQQQQQQESSTASTAAATKWHSRENLLAPEEEGDPQLFVALYEFRAQGENQLSLRKGECVCVRDVNDCGELR